MASNYNARFKPAQVLIENGTSRLISRRDTLDDLLRLQIL
jgi:diaminopimelate decarboxylase